MLTFGYNKIQDGAPIPNIKNVEGWGDIYYTFFKNYFNIESKIIDEIDTKYYYVIDILSYDSWKDKTICTTILPSNVIKDIRNKKSKILFLFCLESFDIHIKKYIVKFIINFAIRNNLPRKSIVVSSGNMNYNELEYNKYADYIPYSIWENLFFYKSNMNWEEAAKITSEAKKSVEEKYIKKKIFLCYNRRPRIARLKLVSTLYNKDLIKFGLTSASTLDIKESDTTFNLITKDFIKILPLVIDDTNMNDNPGMTIVPDDFLRTYISIITETSINEHFPTEKIWKSIFLMHPFIVLSSPRFLEFLKTLGYKTFSKWIDENYDMEDNLDKRILMITDQIKILCEKSREELSNMVFEMKSVLEHNSKNLEKRFNERSFDKQLKDNL